MYTRKTPKNYREYRIAYATVYLNEAATGHLSPVEPAKGGVGGGYFVMVGRTDPSTSDNLNGDGGGWVGECVCSTVCVCARACVCVCVHACVRGVIAIYDNNI